MRKGSSYGLLKREVAIAPDRHDDAIVCELPDLLIPPICGSLTLNEMGAPKRRHSPPIAQLARLSGAPVCATT